MARRRPNPEQAREAWDREVRSLLPAASEETLREVIDHCVSESPRGPGPRARTRAGLIRSMAGLLEDPEDDAEERRAEREGCGRQRDGTVPALFLTCQNLLTPRRARADDGVPRPTPRPPALPVPEPPGRAVQVLVDQGRARLPEARRPATRREARAKRRLAMRDAAKTMRRTIEVEELERTGHTALAEVEFRGENKGKHVHDIIPWKILQ